MAKSIFYRSQIELPIDADHEKSPIRNRELVTHIDSEKHIQNDGLLNQLLVMTAAGPRMMTPKVTCDGFDDLRYSCECNIFFEDRPDADVQFIVLKNNVQNVPDVGQHNHPSFNLAFDNTSDFFRFIPVRVNDYDLSQLTYTVVDNTPGNFSGVSSLIDGKMVFDLSTDSLIKNYSDIIAVGVVGRPFCFITIQLVA